MKPKHSLLPLFSSSAALAGLFFATGAAHAASASWTGGGTDALWSNTDNWSASPVPGTGDTATFNAAAGAGGAVIDLGAGVTVNTITFASSSVDAYTIGAGGPNAQSLTLNGSGNAGLSASSTGGSNTNQITIDAAITVNNSQQWIFFNGKNPWIINGNVTPNGTVGTTRQVKNNGRSIIFNGLLADQVGGALLQIAGANANTATLTNPNNTFTGGLVFDNGSVSVNSIGNIGSASAAGAGGALLFGSGFGGGTLIYTGTGDTTNRVVTVNFGFNGPTLTQSGTSGNLNFTADLAFSSAATAVGSPMVTLRGATAGTGEFSGKLVDNGTTGFTPLKGNAASGATSLQLHSIDGITIGAAVSGSSFIQVGTTVTAINTGTKTITLSQATSGGTINQGTNINVDGLENITHLTKTDNGTWTLSGANTHSGFTKISGGTLTLANALALQNSPIDMVGSINGTASAGLKTTVTTLTLGGLNGTASPKNLASIFTTTSGGYSGVTALTLNPKASASYSYSGVIADGATGMTLTKTGAGTQILGGSNSYTGATTIGAGTLKLSAAGALPSGTAVSIGAATMDVDALTVSAGLLDITGAATINLGSGGTIAFDDSSGVNSGVWSGTLNITGTFTNTSVKFGNSASGLSPGQLALISVNGSGAGTYTLDDDGYLVSGSAAPYDTWATGSEPFDGDANGDGVDDGLAWFLGAATPSANALEKLPEPAKDGSFLTLDFQRVNPYSPAKLYVQFGNDLTGWTEVEVPVSAGTVVLPGDDVEVEVTSPGAPTPDTVTVKIPTSYESASGALFARLRAAEN